MDRRDYGEMTKRTLWNARATNNHPVMGISGKPARSGHAWGTYTALSDPSCWRDYAMIRRLANGQEGTETSRANERSVPMTNAREFIAAVLLALTLTAVNVATAQVVVKVEDLIGTWELVSTKDLNTGAAVYGIEDASTGVQWMLLTRSHYMFIAMERGRSVTNPADFAKLSPEEKIKTNYARVWNEKNQQIFVANGGTYTVEGDTIHQKFTIALSTSAIGADRFLKITHLDKSTMVAQVPAPPINPTTTREVTFHRLD